MTTTIDITPTWQETARMLVVLLERGDMQGQKYAREEIIRMGQIIDKLNAQLAVEEN